MSAPIAVAVVGFNDTGKTQVVEALVGELTRRDLRVGTLKHASGTHLLDTPGKDTWRHREAGSAASAILTSEHATVFLNQPVGVAEAVERLGFVDVVVLEGFRSEDAIPRIVTPREPEEVEALANEMEIAISGPTGEGLPDLEGGAPVIPLNRVGELADIVMSKAFPLLPGLNCGGCGYDRCGDLARAILAGEAEADRCIKYAVGAVRLKVDGLGVAMNPFVQEVMRNVILGVVRTLRGVENPHRVEVAFDVAGDEHG